MNDERNGLPHEFKSEFMRELGGCMMVTIPRITIKMKMA